MCLGQPEKHENRMLSSAKRGRSVKAVVLLGPAPFTVYSAAGMKQNLILPGRRVSFPGKSGDTNP